MKNKKQKNNYNKTIKMVKEFPVKPIEIINNYKTQWTTTDLLLKTNFYK